MCLLNIHKTFGSSLTLFLTVGVSQLINLNHQGHCGPTKSGLLTHCTRQEEPRGICRVTAGFWERMGCGWDFSEAARDRLDAGLCKEVTSRWIQGPIDLETAVQADVEC